MLSIRMKYNANIVFCEGKLSILFILSANFIIKSLLKMQKYANFV